MANFRIGDVAKFTKINLNSLLDDLNDFLDN